MSTEFLICIDNQGYAGSLEVRKIYERLASEPNDVDLVRVVDESGEDYLYPADKFVSVELPDEIRLMLRHIKKSGR